MINIRQKGFDAEREIALDLNAIIYSVSLELGLEPPSPVMVQRNQLQSAVGGKDLVGTFNLAIEVKRQEALSINTWWAQCVKSAKDLNEIPVLLFRQSKQKWRCIVDVQVPLEVNSSLKVRGEIPYDDFKQWFRLIAKTELLKTLQSSKTLAPTLFD